MSRPAAALRVLFAVVAVSAIAACAAPTEPTSPSRQLRAPVASSHDDFSPDSTCRSGWTESGGFKCMP